MHKGSKILAIMTVATFFITVGCKNSANTDATVATSEAKTVATEGSVKAAVLKTSAEKAKAKLANAVDTATCFDGCHETVSMLHTRGAHKDVNCVNCHEIPANHAEEPSPETRPTTRMEWEACGQCHQEQFDSFQQLDITSRPARNDKSNQGGRSPNPAWDKLMAPHGFTKEHASTRSHAVMLIDQFAVDRAFGGRFQGKNGWNYIFETGKVWDVLEDTHPEVPNQKAFMRQTATANNPVCMACKTMDHILDWAYMGDPVEGAKWSRASNPVAMAKEMQHGLNCFICHDPHSAEPRIVRDALIDAMTNPDGKDNLYQKNAETNHPVEYLTMGERGYDRKIAILQKDDPKRKILQCAQCHVEYNCNPGTEYTTKEAIKMTDRRANHFPFKDVLNLYDHYFGKINFQDFKNRFDGSPLWKGQHPDAESYYESKHAQAGIGCDSCHTPAIKDAKGNLKFTSHFAASPRHQLETTCLTSDCHGTGADKKWDTTKYSPEYIKVSTNWDKDKALYSINSIKAYTTSKMRKAEFWLVTLTDAIVAAQRMGISQDIIKQAQLKHSEAHLLWEYWTAENSDGFHNPALAREALTKSIDLSMEGYKLVDDAMAAKGAALAKK